MARLNIKLSLLVIAGSFMSVAVQAQLKTTPVCPPFSVDIMAGHVNKLYPKSSLGEIKKSLPCFTEVVEAADGANCMGVFFKDKGLYFYTDRNYIEIKENFKGKMTPQLLGAARSSLFAFFGYPKIKDISWDAFQMEYGILILYYDKAGKINKIQISSKSVDSIKLCE